MKYRKCQGWMSAGSEKKKGWGASFLTQKVWECCGFGKPPVTKSERGPSHLMVKKSFETRKGTASGGANATTVDPPFQREMGSVYTRSSL